MEYQLHPKWSRRGARWRKRAFCILSASACLARPAMLPAAEPLPPPSVKSLEDLRLIQTIELAGETHHVQGISVEGQKLWLTSVERDAKKGRLHLFSLETRSELTSAEVQQGELYHPGGIDREGGVIWVPVAVYSRAGDSLIQSRDAETLALLSEFRVRDHIGCLAAHGDEIIGGNWDARKIYFWSKDGAERRVIENPLPSRYQDLKVRGGVLVAAGNLARGAGGAIDFLELPSLRLMHSISAGKTDRGTNYTNEGMDVTPGRLFLLPEDAPSRLFVFGWDD